VDALLTSVSAACATADLTALQAAISSVTGTAAEQQSCNEALSLRLSGELDDAEKLYASLLMTTPGLACAKAGLLALTGQRVAIDCLEGQRLLDAHQYSLAVTEFQAAIAAAGNANGGLCGSQGLLRAQAAQDSLAPRIWNDWQHRLVQWGIGVLWALAGIALLALILLIAAGWAVRLLNYVRPLEPRPRLVPRLRLSPITGTVGEATGESLTPLLRSEILTAQSKSKVNLQYVSGASNVQGLVTAVKAVDSQLGAWAQLAASFSWLWPWTTLVVQGQVLPPGREGAGITLSITGGARLPSSVTFWRGAQAEPAPRPAAPAPAAPAAPAAPGPVAHAPAADQTGQRAPTAESPQAYYDLIPAAATWAVYEAARLSRSDSQYFTSAGAVGSAYLAASSKLAPTDKGGKIQFLTKALTADPSNASAQLTDVHRQEYPADEKCDLYLRVLTSSHLERMDSEWLKETPDLTLEIWDVPHA